MPLETGAWGWCSSAISKVIFFKKWHIFNVVNTDHSKTWEAEKIIISQLKQHLPPGSRRLSDPTCERSKGSPGPAQGLGAGERLHGEGEQLLLFPRAVLGLVLLSSGLVSGLVPWHSLFDRFKETGLLNTVLHSQQNTPFPLVWNISETGTARIVH